MKGNCAHALGMAVQAGEIVQAPRSFLHSPQRNGAVAAGAGQPMAVLAQSEPPNAAAMLVQRLQQLSIGGEAIRKPLHIPHANGLIITAAIKRAAIRAEE